MLRSRFGPRPKRDAAERLYDEAVRRSRNPDLYLRMGAPDTVEGRFELLTAHVLIVIDRVNGLGDHGRELAQDLFDLYLRNLDGALREMGVGDLVVGKRMKALGRHIYGRAQAYRQAFSSPNDEQVSAIVARTILAEKPEVSPAPLAAYFIDERRRLAGLTDDHLIGDVLHAR